MSDKCTSVCLLDWLVQQGSILKFRVFIPQGDCGTWVTKYVESGADQCPLLFFLVLMVQMYECHLSKWATNRWQFGSIKPWHGILAYFDSFEQHFMFYQTSLPLTILTVEVNIIHSYFTKFGKKRVIFRLTKHCYSIQ